MSKDTQSANNNNESAEQFYAWKAWIEEKAAWVLSYALDEKYARDLVTNVSNYIVDYMYPGAANPAQAAENQEKLVEHLEKMERILPDSVKEHDNFRELLDSVQNPPKGQLLLTYPGYGYPEEHAQQPALIDSDIKLPTPQISSDIVNSIISQAVDITQQRILEREEHASELNQQLMRIAQLPEQQIFANREKIISLLENGADPYSQDPITNKSVFVAAKERGNITLMTVISQFSPNEEATLILKEAIKQEKEKIQNNPEIYKQKMKLVAQLAAASGEVAGEYFQLHPEKITEIDSRQAELQERKFRQIKTAITGRKEQYAAEDIADKEFTQAENRAQATIELRRLLNSEEVIDNKSDQIHQLLLKGADPYYRSEGKESLFDVAISKKDLETLRVMHDYLRDDKSKDAIITLEEEKLHKINGLSEMIQTMDTLQTEDISKKLEEFKLIVIRRSGVSNLDQDVVRMEDMALASLEKFSKLRENEEKIKRIEEQGLNTEQVKHKRETETIQKDLRDLREVISHRTPDQQGSKLAELEDRRLEILERLSQAMTGVGNVQTISKKEADHFRQLANEKAALLEARKKEQNTQITTMAPKVKKPIMTEAERAKYNKLMSQAKPKKEESNATNTLISSSLEAKMLLDPKLQDSLQATRLLVSDSRKNSRTIPHHIRPGKSGFEQRH